ncbi:Lsr2 family protein [Streptomyces sp. NBC_00237]|uniref:Lsr2 family DNA-binding protein n=1 Tax=Streptomyces sp. NBC_00237 TaxID=2975687 RepID=UPI002251ECA5|nr:histone-like nucleoid-structuring protein Lsr2 [Streptomyces sp. NBC_00237]MCX5207610.1 Lsr2 family protein [Streptomyces sp. NBC_00237]
MTHDWDALAADHLPLAPLTPEQVTAARHTTAHHAHSRADLTLLLDALGIPAALPLTPPGDPMKTSTYTAQQAVAVSLHTNGTPLTEITRYTGISEEDLAPLLADAQDGTPVLAGGLEDLLVWAQRHSAPSVQRKADRIRADIAELTARRQADDAETAAQERVAALQAELQQAQEALRAVKTGSRSPAPSVSQLPQGVGTEDIRAWARSNGHEVSNHGKLPQRIVDAYTAAHHTLTLAEAS